MADIYRIQEILRRDVRPGKPITERQIQEVAQQIIATKYIDAGRLRTLSEQITGDQETFICAAVDVGDIKNELDKTGR